MAKIKLNQLVSQGGSWDEVTEHGLLGDILLPTEKMRFGRQFSDTNKRVVVFVRNKEEKPEAITCSDELSKMLRRAHAKGASKQALLSALLGLRIIETPEKGMFIVPNFDGVEEFTVASLKKEGRSLEEFTIAELENSAAL